MTTNPYVGPRSFETGEALYGRDWEISTLLDLLIAERIVLMHSPSGAGKTSLLRAGLLPQLRNENFNILPIIRVNLDPPPGSETANRYILSTLLSLEEGQPPEKRFAISKLATLSLEAYLDERLAASPETGDPILVFDQFEEILTVSASDREGKNAFFAQLGAALRNKKRWALFSMREDYLGAISTYSRAIPNRLATRFRLDLLGEKAAIQAIQEPAKAAGVEFITSAAQKLVDDLRRVKVQLPDGSMESQPGPYIEPVQLQVVCFRLWEGKAASDLKIDESDLASVGDVNQSLAEYYALSVSRVAQASDASERSIREWFDRKLITQDGIRGQVRMGAEFSDGLPNAVVRRLEDAHIIRAEQRAGQTWYELSHDRLIEPVREDNRQWFNIHLSVFQQQAILWNQQGRSEGLLLRGKALEDARQGLNLEILTPEEKDFLEACDKLHKRELRDRQRNIALTFLAIGATIAMIVAGIFYFKAQESAQKANELSKVALARQLAAQIQSLSEKSPQVAVPLAIQSMSLLPSADAARVLQNNLFPWQVSKMTHGGLVYSVLFSPDGSYVVSEGCEKYDEQKACIQGAARVWDPQTDREISRMVHDDWVRSIAISPNGKYVLSGSEDGTARVWEAMTGKEISRMVFDGWVGTVAFSPDGKYAIAGSDDQTARVWDIQSGKEISRMKHDQTAVVSVGFSSNGKYVFSSEGMIWSRDPIMGGGGGGELITMVWNPLTGKEWMRLGQFVTFSPKLDLALSYGACDKFDDNYNCVSNPVKIFDLATKKEIASSIYLEIWGAAFSPSGKYVAMAGCDERDADQNCSQNSARILDTQTGQEIARILYDGWQSDTSISFNPHENFVLVNASNKIIVWDFRNDRIINELDDSSSGIFSPDGHFIASISLKNANAIELWDVQSREMLARMVHDGDIKDFRFSPDGKMIVSSGGDTAYTWKVGIDQQITQILSYYQGNFFKTALSPDSKYIFSLGDCDGTRMDDNFNEQCVSTTAYIYSAQNGQQIKKFTYPGELSDFLFAQDSQSLLISGCETRNGVFCEQTRIRVLEMPNGDEIATIKLVGNMVSTLSPDGKSVLSSGCIRMTQVKVAACAEGAAHVWELLTGKEISTIRYPSESILDAVSAFSPETPDNAAGQYIVTSSCEKLAEISFFVCPQSFAIVWDGMTGREITRISAQGTLSSKFTNDGKRIISNACAEPGEGDECKTARSWMWDVLTGKEVAGITYPGNTSGWQGDSVQSPDGKYIVTNSCNGVDTGQNCYKGYVITWDASTGEEITRIEQNTSVKVAFSPDSAYIVSYPESPMNTTGVVRVLELATGKEISHTKYDGWVNSAEFSVDGKYILSVGTDNRVWEAMTGRIIASREDVSYGHFSQDGNFIISDKCMAIDEQSNTCARSALVKWLFRPEDLIANACLRIPRNLTRAEWEQYIGDILPYQPICDNLPIELEEISTGQTP
jgi:WD40 repeat protein